VILGLGTFEPLPTDLLVNVILASRHCPERARVEPVPDRDLNTHGVATGKHVGRAAVRDMRLDVNPETRSDSSSPEESLVARDNLKPGLTAAPP